MALTQNLQRPIRDHRLYIWVAVLIPLIVFAGFARTYYLKGWFDGPPLPSLLVHVHGLVMTAWVLLFVTQVGLVARRRTRIHQRLGLVGGGLAALVVIVGILTAIFAAARGSSPGPPPLVFLVIPLGDMLVFAILIGLALYYRRRLEVHKRLMLLASLSLLVAAIARIPFRFIEANGPLAFFGLTNLCILAFVAGDTLRQRRLHPVFIWGTLFIIASQPLRMLLATTDAWTRFASSLVGLVN